MKIVKKLTATIIAAIILLQTSVFAFASEITTTSPYNSKTYTHHLSIDKNKILNGIDVSKHNLIIDNKKQTIDWQKVKENGTEFVFIRIGYRGYGKSGSLNKEAYFNELYDGAKSAGLKIGIYFYSQAISEKEAIDEANFSLSLLDNRKLDLPIVFDYEFAGVKTGRLDSANLTKRAMTDNVLTFCETVEKAGYSAMLYANKTFLNKYLNTNEIYLKYPIWIARYDAAKLDFTDGVTAWQYASDGSVNGIIGNTDANFLYDGLSLTTVYGINPYYIYNGKPITPNITLKYNGKTLKEGVDYSKPIITNNTKLGTATVTINGLGQFDGTSRIAEFQIVNSSDIETSIKKVGIVTAETLNIRNAPSTTNSIIYSHLSNNDYVKIIGQCGNWYKISYTVDGKYYEGYVSKDYVKITIDNIGEVTPSERMGQVMVSSAELKSNPNNASMTITTAKKGYKLYINDDLETGWYKVSYYLSEYETYAGYIEKKYVNIISGEKKPLYRAIFADDVKVYEKASENSKVSSTRVEDALFYVDNTENEWCLVSYSDGGNWYYGYVQKDFLIPKDTKMPFDYKYSSRLGQVMTDTAFLKSAPNENSTSLKQVLKGYKLYINGEENGYFKVSFYTNDRYYAGYFPKQYANILEGEKKPLYRAIFASDVKVYEKASENSKVSSTRVEDALFYVDNTENEWCLVSYSDGGNWYYGYVQKDFLIPKDTKMPFDYKYSSRLGQVMTDTAFLKSAPNENSTSLKQVLKGYKLYINGEENGYFKVSFYTNDRYYAGYFPKQYANILQGERKTLYKATVDKINLREKPNNNSTIVSSRNKGNLLYVDYEIGDWYAVSYSENNRWYYGFVLKSEVAKY